ncbi:hypothetical protein BLNAU_9728 [Blattamonas nauphoetae]|uniref:Uncharacterized protein n=1 Tax=Blattamonas nauphoetae TaxID=2049346 RepID=A0ABQ9XV22_9EUKA|nr:hypothetical protein BLNAU_9728 [Blattamonas nauphoetae]
MELATQSKWFDALPDHTVRLSKDQETIISTVFPTSDDFVRKVTDLCRLHLPELFSTIPGINQSLFESIGQFFVGNIRCIFEQVIKTRTPIVPTPRNTTEMRLDEILSEVRSLNTTVQKLSNPPSQAVHPIVHPPFPNNPVKLPSQPTQPHPHISPPRHLQKDLIIDPNLKHPSPNAPFPPSNNLSMSQHYPPAVPNNPRPSSAFPSSSPTSHSKIGVITIKEGDHPPPKLPSSNARSSQAEPEVRSIMTPKPDVQNWNPSPNAPFPPPNNLFMSQNYSPAVTNHPRPSSAFPSSSPTSHPQNMQIPSQPNFQNRPANPATSFAPPPQAYAKDRPIVTPKPDIQNRKRTERTVLKSSVTRPAIYSSKPATSRQTMPTASPTTVRPATSLASSRGSLSSSTSGSHSRTNSLSKSRGSLKSIDSPTLGRTSAKARTKPQSSLASSFTRK